MKTLFRVLALGTLLTASSALTFAQEKTAEDLAKDYATYKTEKAKPCGQRSAAVTLGKSIVDTYEKIPAVYEDNKPVIDFVKGDYPKIETADKRCSLETIYNESYKAKEWAKFLDTSKQIMAIEGDTPLGLDILLTHVSVGFDRGASDSDSISNAKLVLQKLDAGRTSKTGKWGVFEPFNTKENVQGWMNYIIGTTTFSKLKQTKEALPYFYKVTQIKNEKQNDTLLYTTIGTYYYEEAIRLETDYRNKKTANNNVDTDEIKALIALARGTADRAIDSFGRAYNIAKTDAKAAPALKTSLYKTLTDLYKFRFNLAADAKTPDLDKYIADLVAKPMPDPATAVTPVAEEVKPATTTSTTPTTTTPTTATTTTATTTATTKPTTTTTTTKSTTTTATTTKATTPVKKPVTKKKGTR